MGDQVQPVSQLSAQEKRALLAQVLRKRAEESPPEYPLSYGQRALWFFQQLAPTSGAYHEAFAWRIREGLDLKALVAVLAALPQRHPILRTTYANRDGRPVQRIGKAVTLPPQVTDASSWSAAELQARLAEAAGRPFDLERGPLSRVEVFRRGARESILLTTVHHIAIDLWSMVVLMQDLQALYLARKIGLSANLPPLTCQYQDFVRWQTELLEGPDGERLWAYWQKQLGGDLPVLDLPTDRPRPPVWSHRGAAHGFQLSPTLTQQLKVLARSEQTTLFVTLLSALQVLLARYSGQEDILIASPTAGRSRQEFEGIVGLFANLVVFRDDLSGDPTFRALLGQSRRTVLEGLDHQDFPFARLVERLAPARDASRSPFCDVSFVLQKPHRFQAERKAQGGLRSFGVPSAEERGARLSLGTDLIELLPLDHPIARFDLELQMFETGDGLTGTFRYNSDLFDASTVARMAGHFENLLAGITADPDRQLSDLPLLQARERRQLLVEWNDTRAEYPEQECAHDLFEAQAERAPDAVAVVYNGQHWSYGELNRRANRLARHLRGRGVGPGILVGVHLERSPAMIAALLGILKAGGAYLPLDCDYPGERLAFMLRDAQVSVLITQERSIGRLPPHDAAVVCLDADGEWFAAESGDNLRRRAGPDDLAYVIYTSGSTGVPKGVPIAHRGLCNLARAQIRAFDVRPDSRVLQFASLNFDASVSEIFMALASGAALHLAAPSSLLPGPDLARLLREQAITTVTLPPSALAVLPEEDLPALRSLIVAGESLPAGLVARWAPGRRFFNAYGPTEVTVRATLAECTESTGTPPVGRPIANVQVYVLDRHMQPVPVGVPGELYIGGVGVARGYLNRPELTAERFLPHPLSSAPGARLYRTGDRVRYRADGNLEFLGRTDHQVKLRGFRIELGEVEAVLAQHPGVREAVVLVRANKAGDRSLAAWVIPAQPTDPTAAEIRSFLEEKLPSYMVPSAIVLLDVLPLTPNGKVDRAALIAGSLAPDRDRETFVPPRDDLEQHLVRIWEEILGVPNVGIRDNFFRMGGHSLSAVRMAALVHKQLGVSIPLANLFQGGTVEDLADLVRRGTSASPLSPLVPLQPAGSRRPFFCVHATAGTVLCYRELAQLLGPEQPFYGLQAPGLSGERAPYDRIEELAAHYLDAIRRLQPRGPYSLGGWSLGGVVAFEMARQLQTTGEVVDLLAVMDSSFLPQAGEGRELVDPADMMLFLNELSGPWGKGLPLPAAALRDLTGDDQLIRILEQTKGSNLLPFEIDLSQARVLFQVIRANLRALSRYIPGPYRGKVTLFRASSSSGEWRVASDEWRASAAAGLEVHEVPGDHYTMLEQPHVQVLARCMGACLTQKF